MFRQPAVRMPRDHDNSYDMQQDPTASKGLLSDAPVEVPDPRGAALSFWRRHFRRLSRKLLIFSLVGCAVFIINFSWLIHAIVNYGVKGGYGTIQAGDCGSAKRVNTWLHLLINVLSTLLLAGSNAFMATYSCPSRAEVDEAHNKQRWLHIGTLSFRNLTGIAKRKSFIVLVLSLSSAPFHLL